MWRLVVEPGIKDTLETIDERWNFEDVLDANEALDVFDDANGAAAGDLVPPDWRPHGSEDAEGGQTTTVRVSFGGGPSR